MHPEAGACGGQWGTSSLKEGERQVDGGGQRAGMARDSAGLAFPPRAWAPWGALPSAPASRLDPRPSLCSTSGPGGSLQSPLSEGREGSSASDPGCTGHCVCALCTRMLG